MKLKSLIDVLKDGKPTPMTGEDAEAFMAMSVLDMKQPDFSAPIDDKSPTGLRILQSRLEWVGIADNVSFPVKLFVSSLCDRPGKIVMWAYTLAHMLDLKRKKINMEILTSYFPMGFPADEQQQACWDNQKGSAHGVEADNLMDIKEWWMA